MRLNKSAARTIDIIGYVSSKGKPSTLTEISKALDIPKSSALEILNTLASKHVIDIKDDGTKTIRLSWKLLELTSKALSQNDLHRESQTHLEELSEQTEETVFLAVEDNGEMVYLNKVEGPSMIRATAVLGSRLPMHCGALGKAFLAALPNSRIEDIARDACLRSYTQNTICSFSRLIEEIQRIRKQGYAVDNQEYIPDIFCIGAPIYDHRPYPIASISIATQAYKMNQKKQKLYSQFIVRTALNLSKRMGFTGDNLYRQLS